MGPLIKCYPTDMASAVYAVSLRTRSLLPSNPLLHAPHTAEPITYGPLTANIYADTVSRGRDLRLARAELGSSVHLALMSRRHTSLHSTPDTAHYHSYSHHASWHTPYEHTRPGCFLYDMAATHSRMCPTLMLLWCARYDIAL